MRKISGLPKYHGLSSEPVDFLVGSNRGQLYQVINGLDQTTTYSNYNLFSLAQTVTSPNYTTNLVYDSLGRLLSKTMGTLTTGYTYDRTGKLTRIDLPGTRFITYSYTASGQIEQINDTLGNSIHYLYDTVGNKTGEEVYDPQDQLKRYTNFEYDEYSRLAKIIFPDNSSNSASYDQVGNLVAKINGAGNTTAYTYDALNQLVSITEPGSRQTGYSYDNHGNMTSVTDAEGHVTTFSYDDFNRRLSRTSPDTGNTVYTYDAAGNLVSKTDNAGVSVSYTYDALNRLVAISYPDASQNVVYTYDENNHIGSLTTMQDSTGTTSYDYDALGRLVLESRSTAAGIFDVTYAYNDNSELTSITYPSGRVINYDRDQSGRVATVTSTYEDETLTLASTMSYLPFGPRSAMTLGNGLPLANSYDQQYRLTSATVGTVYNREYGYTADSQVSAITDLIDPTSSQVFSYDALNRLIGAEGSYGILSYSYDNVGNRLSRSQDGTTSAYTYLEGTNQLAEVTGGDQYSYDTVGNTVTQGTTEFSYDQANRVASVAQQGTPVAEYGYDGRNLRIKRIVDGEATYAYYDQSGNVIIEFDDSGNIINEYAYLDSALLTLFSYTSHQGTPGKGQQDGSPGQSDRVNPNGKDTTPNPPGQKRKQEVLSHLPNIPDQALEHALVFSGPVTYYAINDHLGTPQLFVDDTGTVVWQAEYEPFGKVNLTLSETENNIRFPGQYYDSETGLHYNWHRYYDPATGRYLSPDPIGLNGGMNLYLYTGANPINFIDPEGLEIRVYSSDAFGISGLNHAFVYSTETGRGRGTNGSSGATLGNGVGDLTSPYNVAPLPLGMSENDFMDRIDAASGWNNWLWTPWVNDCHSDLENAFDQSGVPYPGAPNGRLDIDDNIRNGFNNLMRQLNQLNNPATIYRLFGGY